MLVRRNQASSDEPHETAIGQDTILLSRPIPSSASDGDASVGNVSSSTFFARHLLSALESRETVPPMIVSAERTTLQVTSVPVRGLKAKRAALPFALEERVSAPLDQVHIALCRVLDGTDQVLAAVLDKEVMRDATHSSHGKVVPETFALPTPGAPEAGPVWAAWRDQARVLVRVSDGTGFCVDAGMMATIWRLAGKPQVIGYGERLPDEIAVARHADMPPPPDAADLAIDLRQGEFAPANNDRQLWLKRAIAVVALAMIAHIAIAVADLVALIRIAEQERAAAQAAIAPMLPGVSVTEDVEPILRRLAPPSSAPQSPSLVFLSLIERVSGIFLDADLQIGFRRLTFSDSPANLTLLIEAPGLEDLQQAERLLRDNGLSVDTGAATASTGLAEAEFTIAPAGEK